MTPETEVQAASIWWPTPDGWHTRHRTRSCPRSLGLHHNRSLANCITSFCPLKLEDRAFFSTDCWPLVECKNICRHYYYYCHYYYNKTPLILMDLLLCAWHCVKCVTCSKSCNPYHNLGLLLFPFYRWEDEFREVKELTPHGLSLEFESDPRQPNSRACTINWYFVK